MKSALPVVAAGSSFVGATMLGFALGVWVGTRTGEQLWVLAGLAAGLGCGAYAAIRLLLKVSQ